MPTLALAILISTFLKVKVKVHSENIPIYVHSYIIMYTYMYKTVEVHKRSRAIIGKAVHPKQTVFHWSSRLESASTRFLGLCSNT